MNIGDIVIVNTAPPHVGSVTDNNMVLCEDGSIFPLSEDMACLCDALTMVKALEKEVLARHEAGGFCDCK